MLVTEFMIACNDIEDERCFHFHGAFRIETEKGPGRVGAVSWLSMNGGFHVAVRIWHYAGCRHSLPGLPIRMAEIYWETHRM